MQLYPSPFTHMHTNLTSNKVCRDWHRAGGGHSPRDLMIYDDIMLQGPGLNYVKNSACHLMLYCNECTKYNLILFLLNNELILRTL